MSDDKQTVSTPGFIVACMNCHGGKGTAVDTKEEAQRLIGAALHSFKPKRRRELPEDHWI